MAFPKPPFKISRKVATADADLLKYLQVKGHVSYLRDDTWTAVQNLKATDLQAKSDALLGLWPKVLTDALYRLKEHDPREWDKKTTKVDYGSFFHEGSLGVAELRKTLESFTKFESMLYGASPDHYRDHIGHAFRVWITGHALLKDGACFGGELFSDSMFTGKREKRKAKRQPTIIADEWECMWAIASLCHDLGYPLSHLNRINSRARHALEQMGLVHGGDLRFSFSPQMLPFHETIIRLMASKPVREGRRFTTHLQNKYYLKLLKSFDDLKHGVVSSLLLSKALVYFLESDLSQDRMDNLSVEDARQFLIRREILRAIASHTCQDIYHLRFDTLSFLLYMVDEIQCWGRSTLEELQHQATSVPTAEAEVIAFGSKKCCVVIRTGKKTWSTDDWKGVDAQLSRLHCMLRLGVDTSMLKGRYLEFAVVPDKGEGKHLLLKGGRIRVEKVDAAHIDCLLGK